MPQIPVGSDRRFGCFSHLRLEHYARGYTPRNSGRIGRSGRAVQSRPSGYCWNLTAVGLSDRQVASGTCDKSCHFSIPVADNTDGNTYANIHGSRGVGPPDGRRPGSSLPPDHSKHNLQRSVYV